MEPRPPAEEEVEAYRMPLLEHLRELRNRLVISGLSLGVGMLLGVAVVQPVYALLTAPMRLLLIDGGEYPEMDALYLRLTAPIRSLLPEALTDLEVQGTLAITASPAEGVYTWLRVALLTGAVFAAPIIAFQVWRFIAPGLYKTERRVVLPLALSSTMLFFLGAAFAYTVLLPIVFPFFLQVIEVQALLSIDGYLRSLVRMLLAFGLCFQLPIVVWFLARLGIVDHRDMIQGFRYAVVGMFLISAILTPPDLISQIILGVPMLFLYGVSIGIAWFWTTKEPFTAEP